MNKIPDKPSQIESSQTFKLSKIATNRKVSGSLNVRRKPGRHLKIKTNGEAMRRFTEGKT